MILSLEAVTSFQELYKEKCGVWLDVNEAQVKALEELRRFALIYKPIPTGDKKYFNELSGKNSKS